MIEQILAGAMVVGLVVTLICVIRLNVRTKDGRRDD
jgi:hypothetical protein